MLLRAAAARLVVRLIFRALFRVRVDGGLPHAGPALVVANHQGWADAFLIAAAFPLRTRIRFLGDRAVASGASVVPFWVAGTAELYLGRPLTLVVGARRAVAKGSPTKARTLALAHEIHDDLAAIALPWTEAVVSAKHMRW